MFYRAGRCRSALGRHRARRRCPVRDRALPRRPSVRDGRSPDPARPRIRRSCDARAGGWSTSTAGWSSCTASTWSGSARRTPRRPPQGRLHGRRRTAGSSATASTVCGSALCGRGITPDEAGRGRPGLPRPVAAGDGPADRAGHLDANRRSPGHVARDVRRRGRAGLGDDPPGAVQPAAPGQPAVPDGLLDARDVDGLDQFWANKHGLVDGWVAAWRVAVRWWQEALPGATT